MRWISLLLLLVPSWGRAAGPSEDTRDAVEAARLYDDGQAMLHAGRYGAAGVTFRTLLYVYPESSLAPQARVALRQAEDLEARAPKVRSLQYRLNVPVEEIEAWFATREISLGVERPYEARDVERARLALEELLASRGRKGTVHAAVSPVKPRSVEVVFTLAKK